MTTTEKALIVSQLKNKWQQAINSRKLQAKTTIQPKRKKGKSHTYTIGWDDPYNLDNKGAIILGSQNYNTATNAVSKSTSRYKKQLYEEPTGKTSCTDSDTLRKYLYCYHRYLMKSQDKTHYLTSLLKNKTFLTDVVLRIDWENSTHLTWAYEMVEQICVICDQPISSNPKKRIVDVLVDPRGSIRDERDDVVKSIAIKGNRKAWSFATKFCYYMTEWLVLGNFKEEDFAAKDIGTRFAIFDSVVAEILPYYQGKHKMPLQKFDPSNKKSNFTYKAWEKALEDVWNQENPKKEQFQPHVIDRILWWGYRNNGKFRNKDFLPEVLQ